MPQRLSLLWLLMFSLLMFSLAATANPSATVKQTTPLLEHPEPNATKLAQLSAEQTVTVLDRSGGWYKVNVPQHDIGWLRLFNLQFSKSRYQPDNTPLRQLPGVLRSSHNQVTSSTGVRGLDKVSLTTAKPDFEQLKALQNLQLTTAEAQLFANQAKLKANPAIALQEQTK
uniref:SH3b domain-containing protein n=1 Tax=Rheinheimera sp. BAL341 TaxID=1708203 RepID=A0A486XU54_9GAMM